MLYSILLLAVGLNPTQNVGHEENVLEEVVVSAEKGIIVNRQDTLSTDGVLSITDLLLKSPSLQISDYGGAAGLKNVSLRGFGSAHTTIYIDGRVKGGEREDSQVCLSALHVSHPDAV